MKNGWIKVINLGGRIQYINSRNINYVIDYEEDGNTLPTSADIKLAYEILNARYINRLPTIISSERYLEEVIGIDEAVGSRICEMAMCEYAWTNFFDNAKAV